MRKSKLRLFGLLATGFILCAGISLAQSPGLTYQEGVELVKQGRFEAALAKFERMEGKDAMLSYYKGLCLVELNRELPEAIEYLYQASRREVASDVDLYLGRAYHQFYNFREALKYYARFEASSSRQEVKESGVTHRMAQCRSAVDITSSYNPYEVITVAFLDMSDSTTYAQIRMKGGQLQRIPSTYVSDVEGIHALMFKPANPVRGDFVYYAAETRSGKEGKQLFRVRKGGGRSWGEPEEIKELNTDGNDILPYFDPIENDLYFASDGRAGIGGYDLYRSHYDRDRDSWSDPINLGFPVNSAMDEYLLLPGSDLGMMMIFSNRQGTDSTLTVYRVHLAEPKRSTDPYDFEALAEIASMGHAAREMLAELEGLDREEEAPAGRPVTPVAYTEVTIVDEAGSASAPPVSAGQFLLSEALVHQAASDSLKDLASAARARVSVSDDPNDRWVWQKQIMVWEKKAANEQAIADALYIRLDMGGAEAAPAAVNPPEPLAGQDEPGTPPPAVAGQEPPRQGNRFDILSASPYSAQKPIPMDVHLPQGVFYRIQLGAFGSPVDPNAFGGVSPITAERLEERGVIKYYAGKFSLYDHAARALERIRNEGYEDAFIVSWYNGKPVSTQKAKQLE